MNEIKFINFPFWKLLSKCKEWDKLTKDNPDGFILWVPNRGKYKCLPYPQWEAKAFIQNWSIVRIE